MAQVMLGGKVLYSAGSGQGMASFAQTGSKTVSNAFGALAPAPATANQSGDDGIVPVSRKELAKIDKFLKVAINLLASIDGSLKQRLSNQRFKYNADVAAAREAVIEGNDQSISGVPTSDAVPEPDSSSSLIGLGLIAVALASQFDPIKEQMKTLFDFSKSVGEKAIGVAKALNGMFSFFLGGTRQTTNEAPQNNPSVASAQTTKQPETASWFAKQQSPDYNPSNSSNGTNIAPVTPFASSTNPSAQVSSSPNTQTPSATSSPAPQTTSDQSSGRSDWFARQQAPAFNPPATGGSSPQQATKQPGWSIMRPDAKSYDASVFNQPGSATPSQTKKDATPVTNEKNNGYTSPVDGHGINSGYGMRNHPTDGGRKFHTGVDIAAPAGTPVKAIRSGKVTRLSRNQSPYTGFGNVVIIDHGNGYQSVYAHLSKFACNVGDQIKQGQIIGYVGSTGKSTGNHLHLIVQKTGFAVPSRQNTIDPQAILKGVSPTVAASGNSDGEHSSGESVAESIKEATLDTLGKAFKGLRELGTIDTELIPFKSIIEDGKPNAIGEAAKAKYAEMVSSKNKPMEMPEVAVSLPNLNAAQPNGTVQNPGSTSSDMPILYQYLQYFNAVSNPPPSIAATELV